MASQSESGPKWKGHVSARIAKVSADQIWPLLTDFFNLHKWFPGLSTCYGIHGANGEPGCVRYCAGFSLPSTDTISDDAAGEGRAVVSWSKERLTCVNPLERSLSYEMVDSNIGFQSYMSTIRVVPKGADDGGGQDGCEIEWSFTVDPVEGWVLDDLVRRYEMGLGPMAQKMEGSFGN